MHTQTRAWTAYQAAVAALHARLNILVAVTDAHALSLCADILHSPIFAVHKANTVSEARSLIARRRSGWHCWLLGMVLGEQSTLRLLAEIGRLPLTVMFDSTGRSEDAYEAGLRGAVGIVGRERSAAQVAEIICKTSALGLLLGGPPENGIIFRVLIRQSEISNVKTWADRASVTRRHLENVCRAECGSTPGSVIEMYQALQSVIRCSSVMAAGEEGLGAQNLPSTQGLGAIVERFAVMSGIRAG